MKFEITWEKSGYLAVFEGDFSMPEVLSCHGEIFKNPKWEKVNYGIIDLTNADLSKMDENDSIHMVSAIHEKALNVAGNRAYAFVATNSHIKKLLEEYRAKLLNFGVPWTLQIFSTMVDARNWIKTQPVAGSDRTR